jgi:hypothetical protein
LGVGTGHAELQDHCSPWAEPLLVRPPKKSENFFREIIAGGRPRIAHRGPRDVRDGRWCGW